MIMITDIPTTVDQPSRATLAITALGFALVTAGLVVNAGYVGLAGGVGLVLCWFVLPSLYTVSIGFVAATALVPDGFTGVTFAPIGLGLLFVLVASIIEREDLSVVAVPAVTALSSLLAVVGGAFLWTNAVLPAAVALLVAFTLIAYGIYRYEIVRIALVTDGEAV